jgi:hypothetical protein
MPVRNFFLLCSLGFSKKKIGQLQRVEKFGQIYLPSCTNVI